jgi:hypothetical protein
MDIKILGSGCDKCQTLDRVTHEAVARSGSRPSSRRSLIRRDARGRDAHAGTRR